MAGFDFTAQSNNPNQPKITPAQWKEFNEFKDEYLKKMRILTFQQQEANDLFEGGLTSQNLKSFRNTIVFNESDSLDADYPFEMDFEVIPETIKIVSVKVSFKIKKFRAYSKAGKSGGGQTSSGSSNETSSATGSASGGGSTSGSTIAQTGECSTYSSWNFIIEEKIVEHEGGYFFNAYPSYHSGISTDHTHYVNTHLHTTPNHTHPNHTHTLIHTHTVTNHTHDADYGIFEEETSPTIHFWISEDDGGIWKAKHGGYTEDQANLDITSYLTLGNGEKMLKFTSDVRCRISARVLLKLDIKARN